MTKALRHAMAAPFDCSRRGRATPWCLGVAALLFGCAHFASAATFVVTNTNDSGAGSLRDAVAVAAPGDTISFGAGLTGTIVLATPISLAQDVTITGPGLDKIAIGGTGNRLLDVAGTARVAISGLTLQDGGGAGVTTGGAVASSGALTLSSMRITQNKASSGGGALYLTRPTASALGTTVIRETTLDANQVLDASGIGGGAILVAGAPAADATAALRAELTLVNTTVSGNIVPTNGMAGAGISFSTADVTIVSSTIAFNQLGAGVGDAAASGANLHQGTAAASSLVLRNSIVSNGQRGAGAASAFVDLYAPTGASFNSLDYNVIQHQTPDLNWASGDVEAAAALLALATTPGIVPTPPPTHAITVASPALNLVPKASCKDIDGTTNLATDERGVARGANFCTAGAFEPDSPFATTTALSSTANPSIFSQSVTFTATLGPSSATGKVTFTDNGANLCIDVAVVAGQASCTTSALGGGSHPIQAAFSGLPTFAPSIGTLTQIVNRASQIITFLPLPARVLGTAPFAVGATSSSGLAVAFATQTPIVCSLAGTTVTMLAAGTCTIRASQAGDANYLAAPVVEQSFNVFPAHTSLALATSNPTVPAGSTITLTATLTGVAPTGSIAFADGLQMLPGCASVALAGDGNTRSAQCQVSNLSRGSHTFAATYAGDANNDGANGSVMQTVTPVSGQPCAGFTDVDATNPFCPSVEWIRNRGVTLGCAAALYCPQDPIVRQRIAAALNRLGTALTPQSQIVEAIPGGLDVDASPIVCATGSIIVGGFPREARVDAVLMGVAPADVNFAVELVASIDAGASWTPLSTQPRWATFAAGLWSSVRLVGDRDLAVGDAVVFGVRLARVTGTADLSDSRCLLRATLGNRNGTFSPFDEER